MSRPKLPDFSWRTCRTTATAVLALLLLSVFTLSGATADPGPPPPPAEPTVQPPAPSTFAVSDPRRLPPAPKHQAAPHSSRPRTAASPPSSQRPTQRPIPRPTGSPERATRASERPALAPSLAGAKSYARSQLSDSEYACLDKILDRESGWVHTAANPSSGAYGLFQALPGSKMASAGSDWRTNPLTQMRWGLSYIEQRYGTPCDAWYFWTKNGWY